MTCIQCGKSSSSGEGYFFGYDGDWMCSKTCESQFMKGITRIHSMTEMQFQAWVIHPDSIKSKKRIH